MRYGYFFGSAVEVYCLNGCFVASKQLFSGALSLRRRQSSRATVLGHALAAVRLQLTHLLHLLT
jgi:hypothetical protein